MTRYPSKTAKKKKPDKAILKVIGYHSCPYMFMYVFIYEYPHTHISTHIKHQIANKMCSDSLPAEKAHGFDGGTREMWWRKMDHKTSNNWKAGVQKQSSCWKVQNAIWWPSRDGKASNRPQSQRSTAGDKNPWSFRLCCWGLSGSCFHLEANIFNWQKGSRKLLGKQQEMGVGDDAFTETWERVQSALVKGVRSLGANFPSLQFGDGYFQYCELILICK